MNDIREKIGTAFPQLKLSSVGKIYQGPKSKAIRRWALGLGLLLLVVLFLPWTQNIRARGIVTTLNQEGRAQDINSIIPGRIVKWYVREGEFVNKGDTLLALAEVKDAYLDPALLQRTQEQIAAKSSSITAYGSKIAATDAQIGALEAALILKQSQLENKVRQLRLKVVGDSMDMVAAANDFRIADAQYKRQRVMRDSGLASLVQVEQRAQAFQSTMAKLTSAEIKLNNTRTDLVNARLELQSAEQEYAEKMFKAQSERAAAQSEQAAGQADLAKLSNQYANYAIRAGQYLILAPQDGQVVGATKSGFNEMVKEGEKLMEIVPKSAQHAVEIFVRPMDVPLISLGQTVRFVFDGYPAIVFSGWPQASYGIFSGRVSAIERAADESGKFRVLVAEDKAYRPWPESLQLGTGAQGIALLKDVPVWYELWRNINGFPPDYYKPATAAKKDKDAEK